MFNKHMQRWVGKAAIVTGASSGIGRAIAFDLARHGVHVLALARREDRLKELKQQALECTGKLNILKCDMTIEDDILKAFEWSENNHGPLHILINNAGVLWLNPTEEMDTNKWRSMFETNVIGLSICAREAIKLMKRNKTHGHIINIGSITGRKVNIMPGIGCYTSTKHAVQALTETLRHEMSESNTPIKVTNVCPGIVVSEMSGSLDLDENQASISSEECSETVMMVLATAPKVNISEITIQPLGELY